MIGYREIMDIVTSDRSAERTPEETEIQIRGLGMDPQGVVRYADSVALVIMSLIAEELRGGNEDRTQVLRSNLAVAISSAFEIGWRAHMRYGGGVDVDAPS